MSVNPDQIRTRKILDQIANNVNDVELDDILQAINLEATMPLRMRSTGTHAIAVDGIFVDNPVVAGGGNDRTRTVPPINGVFVNFTGANITIPTVFNVGSVTSDTSGNSVSLASLLDGEYVRVGVSLDSNGDIQFTLGTPDLVLLNAGAPSIPAATQAIGHFWVRRSGTAIVDVSNANILQYAEGSTSGLTDAVSSSGTFAENSLILGAGTGTKTVKDTVLYPYGGVFATSTGLGVGLSTPSKIFHVRSGASSAALSTSADEGIFENSADAGITIANPAGNTGSIYFANGNGSAQGQIRYSGPSDFMSFYTDAGERVRVASDGNVGINSTNPGHKLTVNAPANGDGIMLQEAGTNRFSIEPFGTFSALLEVQNVNGSIAFGNNSGGSFNEWARFNSSGDFGVGTNPATKIHVEGTGEVIRCSHNSGTIATEIGHSSGNGGFVRASDNAGAIAAIIRGYAVSNVQAYFTAGRIGIGLSNPANLLHVESTSVMGSVGSLNTVNAQIRIEDSAFSIYAGGNTLVSDVSAGNVFAVGTVGAGELSLIVNDAHRVRVDADGNVGINSINPGHKLTVNAPSDDDGIMLQEAGTNRFSIEPFGTLSTMLRVQNTTGSLAFGNNAVTFNEWARFNSSGDFGLGIIPTEKLHIDGSGSRILMENGSSVNTLYAGHSSGNGGFLFLYDDAGSSLVEIRAYGGNAITNFNGGDFRVNTNTISVDASTSRVGIGITTPDALLHINSATEANVLLDAGANQNCNITFRETVDAMSIQYNGGDNTLRFRSELGYGEIMRMNSSNGRVGIGTVSPDALLHVSDLSNLLFDVSNSTYPTIENPIDGDVLQIASSSSITMVIDSNNNGTTSAFSIANNGKDGAGGILFRVEEDGTVGINTLLPLGTFHIRTSDAGAISPAVSDLVIENSGDAGIAIYSGNTSAGSIYFGDVDSDTIGEITYSHNLDRMEFVAGGSVKLRLESGAVKAFLSSGSTVNTVYYNTSTNELTYASSTIRDKENVRLLEISSEVIYELEPKTFERKSNGETEIGYIAEEVFNVEPRLVGLDGDGNPGGVFYQWMPILNTEEIKKLKSRIEILENEIADLKS